MLLWVYSVGGMAAFRSSARLYNESAFKILLAATGKETADMGGGRGYSEGVHMV